MIPSRLPLPMKNIEDLDKNKPYKVTRFLDVRAGRERRIVLTIQNKFDIMLPPRASKKMEKNCSAFLKMISANARFTRLYIVYRGRGKFNFDGSFVCKKLKIQ